MKKKESITISGLGRGKITDCEGYEASGADMPLGQAAVRELPFLRKLSLAQQILVGKRLYQKDIQIE